ncbi:hypothetical protein RCL1_004031 [Eukaryota sp. TZLM3-RCL]
MVTTRNLKNVKSKIDMSAPTTARRRATSATSTNPTTSQPATKKKRVEEPQPDETTPYQQDTPRSSDDPYSLPPKPPKVPSYDLKAKLEGMQTYASALQAKFLALVEERRQVLQDLSLVSDEKSQVYGNLEEVRQRLVNANQKEEELSRIISGLKSDIQGLENNLENANKKISKLEEDLNQAGETISQLRLVIESSQSEINQLKNELNSTRLIVVERDQSISNLNSELDSFKAKLQILEARLREDDLKRRKLHNDVLELKGNIRVFVRVRPFLPDEITPEAESAFTYPENTDNKALCIAGDSRVSVDGSRTEKKPHNFEFDHVFSEHSTQNDVFKEVSQLVQSALDGFRVVIFCYGATGSGKTFTMEGTQEAPGIIPKSVELLFQTIEERREIGLSSNISMSTVEIYNENLIDLLVPPSEQRDLDIKHVDGKTTVHGLKNHDVATPQQVFEHLQHAQHSRKVAATLCNDRSSRSHLVFSLEIETTDTSSGHKSNGILNLIDLAGSERIAVSGSIDDPERRKEAISINKSLTSLGNCISALSRKDRHIPFRDSKLTWLLQQSLLGDAKVLMFANMACSSTSAFESLNTLRFAKKVNDTHIGRASKTIS